MQGRTSSTAAIFNQFSSIPTLKLSPKTLLGGLLVLLLPDVTVEWAHTPTTNRGHFLQLESIYFYDPSHQSIYKLIVNANGYAKDLIAEIRNGLCGAVTSHDLPTVDFETIGEWGWNHLATLLRALNQETQQAFKACLDEHIGQRAELQEDAYHRFLIIAAIVVAGFVLIGMTIMAGAYIHNRIKNNKYQFAAENSQQPTLELDRGCVPNYGSFRS